MIELMWAGIIAAALLVVAGIVVIVTIEAGR